MRLPLILLPLAFAELGPALAAQESAGSELWRLAAATLPVPAALATGSAAMFWNPAQGVTLHSQLGLDFIQTPEAVGATGVIAGLRIPVHRVGALGVVYGRIGLGDLVRTTDSPDPAGEAIPYYAQTAAVTWARTFGRSTLGASLTFHDTQLDGTSIEHWTFDAGVSQPIGRRARIAASTRGFQRIGGDPAQDVYAAMEYRLWSGMMWHGTAGTLVARYGLTFGHPGGADNQLGAGLDIGSAVSLDLLVAHETTYGNTAWRGAAGVRISVGRYRLSVARDGGVSDLGSTFRVGLEARLK